MTPRIETLHLGDKLPVGNATVTLVMVDMRPGGPVVELSVDGPEEAAADLIRRYASEINKS